MPQHEYAGFVVDLEEFSGPLDLLLSLIRRDEIDILDIPIARITDQYLAALDAMRGREVEVGGEFIVMAAALMQIKSRMLLPKPAAQPGEEEEEDPRQELVALLLEYQRYREAAEVLGALSEARARLVGVPGERVDLGPQAVAEVSLTSLFLAFERLLSGVVEPEPPPLRPTPYTVREQADVILARVAAGPVAFRELFSGSPTRLEVVVTFMALLELIAAEQVRAVQPETFGEIEIRRVDR